MPRAWVYGLIVVMFGAGVPTISRAASCVSYEDAPPFEGSIVPYKSGTVLTPEQSRALAEGQSSNLDGFDQTTTGDAARQAELDKQAAPRRAAADQRVQDFAADHPVDGFEPSQTSMSVNTDTGDYNSIELQYVGPDGNVHYTAQFDGGGNPLGGVEQTPWGAASQNANSHAPPGAGQSWEFGRNGDGESYPSEVRIADEGGAPRGRMKFNEDGIAYWGEFFDENGNRTGGFFDPRLEPTYDDPDGDLAEVDYEKIATGACEPCEGAQKARNAIANEINQVAREMNDHAQRHKGRNEYARENKSWDQSLKPMRMRYEHLAGSRAKLQQQLEQADQALQQCCDAQCGEVEDDDDAYTAGGNFTPVPLTLFRIGQDSNTFCRHGTGTGTPVVVGPGGLFIAVPPTGPSTVEIPPSDYSNTTTQYPQPGLTSTPPVVPVTTDCTGPSCPGEGLVFPIGDLSTTTQPKEVPCDCSAEEAALKQAQTALDTAEKKLRKAEAAFSRAKAVADEAYERLVRAGGKAKGANGDKAYEELWEGRRVRAARDWAKAYAKQKEADAAVEAAKTAVEGARAARTAARKALAACRAKCPGSTTKTPEPGPPGVVTGPPSGPGTTTDQPKKPCDCSAEEAAVKRAQTALDTAEKKLRRAKDAHSRAKSVLEEAETRWDRARDQVDVPGNLHKDRAKKRAERALEDYHRAQTALAKAEAQVEAMEAMATVARAELKAARKALAACRAKCPGGTTPKTPETGQPGVVPGPPSGPGTTTDQPKKPCDCSAEEAAVKRVRAALNKAEGKLRRAEGVYDRAKASASEAREREARADGKIRRANGDRTVKELWEDRRIQALKDWDKANAQKIAAAKTVKAAQATVDAARAELKVARKALAACRAKCPGGSNGGQSPSKSGQSSTGQSAGTQSGGGKSKAVPPTKKVAPGSNGGQSNSGPANRGQPNGGPANSGPANRGQPKVAAAGAKVKVSARSGVGGAQQPVAGQSVKVFGAEFGLPPECAGGCYESNKTDVAFGQGASQCTTGSDGACTLDVSSCARGAGADCDAAGGWVAGATAYQNQTSIDPQTGPVAYTLPVTLDGTPVAGSIATVSGAPGECALGGGLCDAVTDQFAIGPNTYFVFAYPASTEQSFVGALGQDPNVSSVETNYCDEKKLPVPRQYSKPVAARSRILETAERIGYAKIQFGINQPATGE